MVCVLALTEEPSEPSPIAQLKPFQKPHIISYILFSLCCLHVIHPWFLTNCRHSTATRYNPSRCLIHNCLVLAQAFAVHVSFHNLCIHFVYTEAMADFFSKWNLTLNLLHLLNQVKLQALRAFLRHSHSLQRYSNISLRDCRALLPDKTEVLYGTLNL